MIYQIPAPRLGITKISEKGRKATARIEGLPEGIAHVLGNSLRIILMSQIPGYAPREYILLGVSSKYDSIPGVVEAGPEIEQSIKYCRVKPTSKSQGFTITVDKEVNGALTLGEMQSDVDVEILNPEHIILTTEHPKRIHLTIRFESGVGFIDEDKSIINKRPVLGSDKDPSLIVDSDFSPVVFANYRILEDTPSIGQETLLMDIETNGIITPTKALGLAGQVMTHYGSVVGEFKSMDFRIDTSLSIEGLEPSPRDLILEKKPIEDLILTTETYNELKAMGIKSLRDIVSKQDIITDKIKQEVIRKLSEIGFMVEEIKE